MWLRKNWWQKWSSSNLQAIYANRILLSQWVQKLSYFEWNHSFWRFLNLIFFTVRLNHQKIDNSFVFWWIDKKLVTKLKSFSRGIFLYFCATKSAKLWSPKDEKRGKKFITQKCWKPSLQNTSRNLYKLLNWIMVVVIESKGAYIHYSLICNQLIYVIVSLNDMTS